MKRVLFTAIAVSFLFVLIEACSKYYFRSNYEDSNKLIHETKNLKTKPFLKAHLKNGNVCILKDSWQIDSVSNVISGTGVTYDFNRKKLFEGEVKLLVDSISVFETNTKIHKPEAGRSTAIGLLIGLDVIMAIVCITDPKACFGSCPTFYINENDNFHYADAEGFSNAISPSMEYGDFDALNKVHLDTNLFSLTMKNEALETHCINDVKLLAFPLNKNERVYQSPSNTFFLCENIYQLSKAKAEEGDVTALLNKQDYQERFSLSDEKNLSSKEEIYLTFNNVQDVNNPGIVLSFRQTLMSTYIFYNSIAYMGDEVGDFYARMEADKDFKTVLDNGIRKELGYIDIFAWDEKAGSWKYQTGFFETGPIACNKQIVALQNLYFSSTIKIKVVLNKGLWRMDYFSLTNIKQTVTPEFISPSSILNKGKLDKTALEDINSNDEYLISMPGDSYKFNFVIPKINSDYELFVYSKGYYLEWIRSSWLQEKNIRKLNEVVFNPAKYLKEEASSYKKYEATMEAEFWNSKIDTKAYSYHEN